MFKMEGSKIISDEGFEVQVLSGGMDGPALAYFEHEKNKFILLDAYYPGLPVVDPEELARIPLVVRIPRYLRWLRQSADFSTRPDESGALSNEDQARIIRNIERALRYVREPFKLVKIDCEPL